MGRKLRWLLVAVDMRFPPTRIMFRQGFHAMAVIPLYGVQQRLRQNWAI